MRVALNTSELRAALAERGAEVTRRTVMRWTAAGCPHRKGTRKTDPLQFDLEAVMAWLDATGRSGETGPPVGGGAADELAQTPAAPPATKLEPQAHGGSPATESLMQLIRKANLRIKHADAEKKELEVAAKRREMIPFDEARRFWAGQQATLHAAARAAPGAWATRLVQVDYETAYRVVEDGFRALLEQMASEVPA